MLLDGLLIGLEKDCRPSVQFSEFLWVDLAHLQDNDTGADDKEPHDNGEDLRDSRL